MGEVVMSVTVLTPKEAAARLKVSTKMIAALCAQGKLRGVRKVGRLWRIPEWAVDAFFEEDTRAGLPGAQEGDVESVRVGAGASARVDHRSVEGRRRGVRGEEAPRTASR